MLVLLLSKRKYISAQLFLNTGEAVRDALKLHEASLILTVINIAFHAASLEIKYD